MTKPDGCAECPWRGDGEGFVPDEIPPKAQVVFVAQNPGEVEETQGRPLVGVTGQIFKGRFVGKHLPGIPCGYANVVKCRATNDAGQHTNKMPPLWSQEWRAVAGCCEQYLRESLKAAPDAIIVPMGEYAAQAVTGMRAKLMIHLRGTVIED